MQARHEAIGRVFVQGNCALGYKEKKDWWSVFALSLSLSYFIGYQNGEWVSEWVSEPDTHWRRGQEMYTHTNTERRWRRLSSSIHPMGVCPFHLLFFFKTNALTTFFLLISCFLFTTGWCCCCPISVSSVLRDDGVSRTHNSSRCQRKQLLHVKKKNAAAN